MKKYAKNTRQNNAGLDYKLEENVWVHIELITTMTSCR